MSESSLSADAIGNQFAVQELYGAGQNFRLAEMNYQQDFLEHKVTIELGWSPVGDNFAGLPYFCNFQNGMICGHANPMTTDSGAHNFPTAQWGARINVNPRPNFYVATGIYQVNPNGGDSDKGFDLSFRSTGAFVPIELGWLPGQGSGRVARRLQNRRLLQFIGNTGPIQGYQWTACRADRRTVPAAQRSLGWLHHGRSDGLSRRIWIQSRTDARRHGHHRRSGARPSTRIFGWRAATTKAPFPVATTMLSLS